ncbi:hypothetical protein [Ruegeria sp. PrR005]|uniref:Uncharacterized protein n=1 Tax=Ruegeria sp. PrR005 TaxID=2706882 RepID=A0A6B2NV98_9RHOB|nr:hypothetical protein [Ruegeria sp. PrR005]NDW46547.1 hypothetical protein [Ruegeria sp. PrR005]
MSKIEKAKPNEVGVEFSGSAETGHEVKLKTKDALQKIFGTSDEFLAEALFNQCLKPLRACEASDKYPANDERAFMMTIVNDLAPRDAVERMLAVQMAATHVATIRSARWLANADTIPQVQAHYTGYNKLARTFAAQAEALRKHRTGGEQKVTVQHVNVSNGGQAIVGNVQAGGRGKNET